MTVLGVDLAAGYKKTYACKLEASDGGLLATIEAGCDDETLVKLATGCQKVGIDAPFGWPDDFVKAIVAHRHHKRWPGTGEEPDDYRARLSFRATDRAVMPTRRPLSVSTDKLGVTAMRCALLLDRWSKPSAVDRTGAGRFVEVYPAAALVRWGLDTKRYKLAGSSALGKLLSDLKAQLPALGFEGGAEQLCATNDDAFDALVAALVAQSALLGLTDPPPRHLHRQAAREGWIHLPARGSLPFLGKTKADLKVAPAPALAEKLSATGIALTPRGYAERVEDILLPGTTPATAAAVAKDLTGKGGSELKPRRHGQPKFYAAHSSAALAANAFGPFLRDREGVRLGGKTYNGETRLEASCPTGLGGTPPTLDVLVKGTEILAIESKCTEYFSAHPAKFSSAYDDALADAHKSWREEYEWLKANPTRYRFLDAAQLVKHYLGLRKQFPKTPVTLAYVYWEPANANDIATCGIHAAEVAAFANQVNDPKLHFVPLSYRELWDEWAAPRRPSWLREHVNELRSRYEVTL